MMMGFGLTQPGFDCNLSSSSRSMNTFPTQFVTSRRMEIDDAMHQIGIWGENFKSNGIPNPSAPIIIEADTKLGSQSEDISHGFLTPSNKYEEEATKPDKIQKRLAQNREAARKSRMRKKAYVQQLETSRLKLIQLEQELVCARQQGLYVGGGVEANVPGFAGRLNSGIATFEMKYEKWLEVQNAQICELRTGLNAHVNDERLRILVESGKKHYNDLFLMKATAAKADVLYVMYGMWKTTAERFFLWMGGFRPSELLKVLVPQLDPLTDKQVSDVCHLRKACQQAEDALSQGMDRLQQILAESVAAGRLVEGS
ncbi:bZIP_1 domain-containing protein/DOG1 domain-containing protein [Cephalotus follicularis]|uniref:BZIP_1 domain-containing protein/DOG1 domain-containing protein n=1 Tax=Cephalotus follicularis TaxID=3775 RepID=A0A1Q3AW32_CEPFO|nr:bZIP_1 domain-containing protein/DOG1 domain-containing protein [Cephalotus follicularis]